ncbi:UNVERIFIED_CONTAM: hypothetical protein FKN15_002829 [Acipenser sinensis]
MTEPKYREWILETIDSLRSRKARPDLERICRMVRRRHGSDPDQTRTELEKLIQDQIVLKVSYKGSISYRNAAKVQRKSRKKLVEPEAGGDSAAASSTGRTTGAELAKNASPALNSACISAEIKTYSCKDTAGGDSAAASSTGRTTGAELAKNASPALNSACISAEIKTYSCKDTACPGEVQCKDPHSNNTGENSVKDAGDVVPGSGNGSWRDRDPATRDPTGMTGPTAATAGKPETAAAGRGLHLRTGVAMSDHPGEAKQRTGGAPATSGSSPAMSGCSGRVE